MGSLLHNGKNSVRNRNGLSNVELSIKNMFFTKNFEGLRALACDPDKTAQLSFCALICIVLAVAFKWKSYQDTEKLLNRLTQSYKAHGKIDTEVKAIIIDERLASPTNVTALHKLAQTCALLSMMLGVAEAPPELVSFFKESGRVWRQRAVKPPVHTGKMLVTRAYDLMVLGEKDKAEENIMMALSKGIKGDSFITTANVLKYVGQYSLAEEFYIKANNYTNDEQLKDYIKECSNQVHEQCNSTEVTSAAATRTDNK